MGSGAPERVPIIFKKALHKERPREATRQPGDKDLHCTGAGRLDRRSDGQQFCCPHGQRRHHPMVKSVVLCC